MKNSHHTRQFSLQNSSTSENPLLYSSIQKDSQLNQQQQQQQTATNTNLIFPSLTQTTRQVLHVNNPKSKSSFQLFMQPLRKIQKDMNFKYHTNKNAIKTEQKQQQENKYIQTQSKILNINSKFDKMMKGVFSIQGKTWDSKHLDDFINNSMWCLSTAQIKNSKVSENNTKILKDISDTEELLEQDDDYNTIESIHTQHDKQQKNQKNNQNNKQFKENDDKDTDSIVAGIYDQLDKLDDGDDDADKKHKRKIQLFNEQRRKQSQSQKNISTYRDLLQSTNTKNQKFNIFSTQQEDSKDNKDASKKELITNNNFEKYNSLVISNEKFQKILQNNQKLPLSQSKTSKNADVAQKFVETSIQFKNKDFDLTKIDYQKQLRNDYLKGGKAQLQELKEISQNQQLYNEWRQDCQMKNKRKIVLKNQYKSGILNVDNPITGMTNIYKAEFDKLQQIQQKQDKFFENKQFQIAQYLKTNKNIAFMNTLKYYNEKVQKQENTSQDKPLDKANLEINNWKKKKYILDKISDFNSSFNSIFGTETKNLYFSPQRSMVVRKFETQGRTYNIVNLFEKPKYIEQAQQIQN